MMGNLLKLLTREDQDAGGSKIDIFLDFESKCNHNFGVDTITSITY